MVLVFGGSHGARSINQAVVRNLEALLREAQVVHLTGELDWPWVSERAEELPPALRSRYSVHSYLHEMAAALAAADLAVCRAGASTLGELPYFGLPAILVPYPHAWRYQRTNARWLADQDAAIELPDEELDQALLPAVQECLSHPERVAEMRERARGLSRPDAAERLAMELKALARPSAEEAV